MKGSEGEGGREGEGGVKGNEGGGRGRGEGRKIYTRICLQFKLLITVLALIIRTF